MEHWRDELERLIEATKGPTFLTLATTDRTGVPSARMLVLRGIDPQGRLLMCSDARSCKNDELRDDPRAAALFWFNDARTQFRLQGMVEILSRTHIAHLQVWRELSDSARALFTWPDPGADRAEVGAFATAVPAEAAVPESFEVLCLDPQEIDYLNLSEHPHVRRLWDVHDELSYPTDVNP